MTFREPYDAAAPSRGVTPFRRYMLTLTAESIVRNVPLAVVYHGQVRGDAGPLKEDTTERRALEEGRQIVRWQDNASHYQRGGQANRGKTFAASSVYGSK